MRVPTGMLPSMARGIPAYARTWLEQAEADLREEVPPARYYEWSP